MASRDVPSAFYMREWMHQTDDMVLLCFCAYSGTLSIFYRFCILARLAFIFGLWHYRMLSDSTCRRVLECKPVPALSLVIGLCLTESITPWSLSGWAGKGMLSRILNAHVVQCIWGFGQLTCFNDTIGCNACSNYDIFTTTSILFVGGLRWCFFAKGVKHIYHYLSFYHICSR